MQTSNSCGCIDKEMRKPTKNKQQQQNRTDNSEKSQAYMGSGITVKFYGREEETLTPIKLCYINWIYLMKMYSNSYFTL